MHAISLDGCCEGTMDVMKALERIALEPPLRALVFSLLHVIPSSVKTRARWGVSERAPYLLGVVTAAEQAMKHDLDQISVIEFGVAGGAGLLILEKESAAVEKELGIKIDVYGFDAGAAGLPKLIGDYRDHPDAFQPGDYPMDEVALRARLSSRTTLILGNVADTVSTFFDSYNPPPIGFVSIDVDLYSSTRDALKIFTLRNKRMLRQVPMYFDDINRLHNHKFAGELLAIEEFNQENRGVKIDRWYAVKQGSPYPERFYFDEMYVAHDLDAISKFVPHRDIERIPLQ